MLTVHHLNNSRSQRVLWLLEELGAPYDIRYYQRNAETLRAPPELTAIHPLGRSPVISDGDTVVAETGAIIEYLLEVHGNGRMRPPAGTAAARRFSYWLHAAEGTFMPPLLMRLVFDRMGTAPMPFFARPIARGLVQKVRATFIDPATLTQLAFIEGELSASGWFAGSEFSAADVQMSFPLEVAAMRVGLGSAHPNVSSFLARIHARPAYRRALERGGSYAFATP